MALPFPIVPVLVGAAVGAAVTYLLTKVKARKDIMDSLEDLGDAVSDEAERVADAASEGIEEVSGAAKRTASKIRGG